MEQCEYLLCRHSGNVRQFVQLIWMMCQSDLIRFLRSQRVFKLVKVTKKDPRTLYLVLECHVSGDHGQNATLSYDTYLWQTSVGIWGVTDFPLKYEVREQYDDRNALLIDDLDNTGGEPEQSCKNDNQQQYMIMSTLRRAYPMLRTKNWLKHGRRPIQCGSMVTMINRV